MPTYDTFTDAQSAMRASKNEKREIHLRSTRELRLDLRGMCWEYDDTVLGLIHYWGGSVHPWNVWLHEEIS